MAAGDTNLFFNRDTKVYLEQGTTLWELPVLNGYSFSQATNSSNITLNEMSDVNGRSRRGQKVFNDSLAPAEWSFDIYARPTIVDSKHRAPEEALWNSLLNGKNFDLVALTTGHTVTATNAGTTVTLTFSGFDPRTTFAPGHSIVVSGATATTNAPNGTFVVTGTTATTLTYTVTSAPTGSITGTILVKATNPIIGANQLDFTPAYSNVSSLATFTLYFVLGATDVSDANYTNTDKTTIYKIEECCVNEATMNFEIDGISTVSWSGMGKKVTESNALDASTAVKIGLTATNNMIRNRLTSATLVGVTPTAKTYGITLTGGSITISNNMTFLTPESIGVVNTPLAHVTGGRSVTGSLSCYADELTNGSIDLYQDLLGATTTVTNKFTLAINVGGGVAPNVLFDMGQCHLEVPTINIDDVIGFEVNFTALPSNISGTDELTKIRYVGV